MEISKLNEINKRLETTDIKGKAYVEVNQRILAFRELYENGSIETDLIQMENGICTFKAIVKDNEGKIIATGHAQEKESSSFINKTSYIENCETSAVGRALGILGIGATNSVASAEEVINAINNQNQEPKDRILTDAEAKRLYAVIVSKVGAEKVVETLSKYGIDNTSKATAVLFNKIVKDLK